MVDAIWNIYTHKFYSFTVGKWTATAEKSGKKKRDEKKRFCMYLILDRDGVAMVVWNTLAEFLKRKKKLLYLLLKLI